MRFDEMLTRRSYPGMGTEPLVSYAYRKIGFFVSVFLFLGGIASITMLPSFSALFGYALLGGVGGVLLLFIGIAFSEAWASAICRSNYASSTVSYRKRQLIFSFVGVIGLATLVVVVAYFLPAL